MKDALGNRMKEQYENRTRFSLPRRTYTIIRCDGKSFHTYTRKMTKPFSSALFAAMDDAAKAICKEASGVQFAYIQSDEVSVLLTDFATDRTEAWFNGNIQKIVSVSASFATAAFNLHIDSLNIAPTWKPERPRAHFDSRVFSIPDPIEVENYFIWRQQDWTRNSVQAVAQSLYSAKQLHGKNNTELQELIFQKGKNWNDYATVEKRGRIIRKNEANEWVVDKEIPIFTQERKYLRDLIPRCQLPLPKEKGL